MRLSSRTRWSMSRGVTNRASPSAGGASSPTSRSARITVGSPKASTGTPRVFSDTSLRWLPTPEPGTRPASVNCKTPHSRSRLRAAKASSTMIHRGRSISVTAAINSQVSTPVSAKTPVVRAATEEKPRNSWGMERSICRVTRICPSASGPTASAVSERLPRPTTSTGSSPPGSRAISSRAMHWAPCTKKSFRRCRYGASSMVMYFPTGRSSRRACSGSVSSM